MPANSTMITMAFVEAVSSFHQPRIRSLLPIPSLKGQIIPLLVHHNGIPLLELPLQDLEGERILDQVLDGPLQGPGPIDRIEPLFRQELLGRVREYALPLP